MCRIGATGESPLYRGFGEMGAELRLQQSCQERNCQQRSPAFNVANESSFRSHKSSRVLLLDLAVASRDRIFYRSDSHVEVLST